MGLVTSKNLFTLVKEEIEKRSDFTTNRRFNQQLERPSDVAPFAMSSRTNADVSSSELLSAIQAILNRVIPQRIISGLVVTAEDPISANVLVTAGEGSIGGSVFELAENTTLPIPFDSETTMFYVVLSRNTLMLEKASDSNKLTLAKIVVPQPGTTNRVRNNRDASLDAYIMQYQEYKLYGDANGKFEEDTKELFKDNIGDILAETIVGTMTLNDNLKITNISGTLALDSTSMKISDFDGNMLAKFNQRGVFFYNPQGVEIAKFSTEEAHLGNIRILPTSIQSGNFVTGYQGFKISDSGNAEFNDMVLRGTIYARAGVIGGFTITPTMLYGGIIQTGPLVAAGETGVVMDSAGLRGYDSVLGNTFNLPTDGSAPTFASGIIRSTIFEINTSAVLRTSDTVGDGTVNSAGILINNTGIYGCEASQTLAQANFKLLIDGSAYFRGQINATTGQIGNVTITSTMLTGGVIQGTSIYASVMETSSGTQKVRIDSTGIRYLQNTTAGKFGYSTSGNLGFKFSTAKFGSGTLAYLFDASHPIFSIEAERTTYADLRLYNRNNIPTGASKVGDIICQGGVIKSCIVAGTPGTYAPIGNNIQVLEIIMDGGGSVLPTGVFCDVEVPYGFTINQVALLADQSGSIAIDIWNDMYANYPPTSADTIIHSGGTIPTITTATKSKDSTLTNWTTSIPSGSTLRFNINSVTSITRCTLSMKITKT